METFPCPVCGLPRRGWLRLLGHFTARHYVQEMMSGDFIRSVWKESNGPQKAFMIASALAGAALILAGAVLGQLMREGG